MSAVTPRDEWAGVLRAIRIVHDIPGRLRLRLPPGVSTAGLGDVIDRLNGAHSSVWSPRTRSLLIRYDASVLTPEDITRTVAEHANLDLPSSSDIPHAADEQLPVGTAVTGVFRGLNESVARRTRGRLDLPILISIGLALWASRQVLRGPITPLAWTSALWYAHGLFRDYHAPARDR
jgi:heavy-metal-associated domain-containing protein